MISYLPCDNDYLHIQFSVETQVSAPQSDDQSDTFSLSSQTHCSFKIEDLETYTTFEMLIGRCVLMAFRIFKAHEGHRRRFDEGITSCVVGK